MLQKIQDAEARGDKRTARYLAESMAKHDMAAADLAEQEMIDAVNKFIDDDIAASEDRRIRDQQQRIELRAQELLRVDGSNYKFSVKLAREQATREIVRPRYEDDINDEPEKPDRQAILDAHKASFEQLMKFRTDNYDTVTLESCKRVFAKRFDLLSERPIPDSQRHLLFLRSK